MKPTDLWGKLPTSFEPKMCKNKRHPAWWKTKEENANSCPHQPAYKKNKFPYLVKGGEGNSAMRALNPYGLSEAMCIAMEKDLPDTSLALSELKQGVSLAQSDINERGLTERP